MFWRRYVGGLYPLLVWADDEQAADITASIHAAALPPIRVTFFVDPSTLELPPVEDDA